MGIAARSRDKRDTVPNNAEKSVCWYSYGFKGTVPNKIGKEGGNVFSMRDTEISGLRIINNKLQKCRLQKNLSQNNQLHKNKKLPSPKCVLSDESTGTIIEKTFLLSFLKRLVGGLGKKVCAAMTVEAAIVLPLFLFFFINLGSAIEMIRLHGNLQMGLWNVGNKMCVYGYAADGEKKWEEWGELGDIALTYTYVKNQVITYSGEDYLNASPLTDGTASLQFWESRVMSQNVQMPNDTIDILMTYQVSPWLNIPFVKPFRMSNRYYGRMWTGYDLTENTGSTLNQEMVYVTENREVYHESLACTHLKLSIQTISREDLRTAKNQYGRRYALCSKCRRQSIREDGILFVCDEGDYFHYSRNCPGLTRIISTITRQQAMEENLRPCSRCGRK